MNESRQVTHMKDSSSLISHLCRNLISGLRMNESRTSHVKWHIWKILICVETWYEGSTWMSHERLMSSHPYERFSSVWHLDLTRLVHFTYMKHSCHADARDTVLHDAFHEWDTVLHDPTQEWDTMLHDLSWVTQVSFAKEPYKRDDILPLWREVHTVLLDTSMSESPISNQKSPISNQKSPVSNQKSPISSHSRDTLSCLTPLWVTHCVASPISWQATDEWDKMDDARQSVCHEGMAQ